MSASAAAQPTNQPTVLVFGATGQQGSAVVDALRARGGFDIVGTSRTVPNKALEAKGVRAIKFEFGNAASAEKAIAESNASFFFFFTDFFVAAGEKADVETAHGLIIVDAIKKASATQPVNFVVFSSAADAELAPKEAEHFASKVPIEKHLAASGLQYGILRPVFFFENYNNAQYAPLKPGKISSLQQPDLKIKSIATHDIGLAAAGMIANPQRWNGKTVSLAAQNLSGVDAAAALTLASGIASKYEPMLGACAYAMFISADLKAMFKYFEEKGMQCECPSADFLELVPKPTQFGEWLTSVGQFSTGRKFRPVQKAADAEVLGCCA